jgi:multicomponent Na+:H+ antiporter subunit D
VSWLVVAPLLIPLAGALLAYLVPRSWIGVAGAAALLAAGTLLLVAVTRHGVLVAQIGGWPAPFGISLVADHLSAFMVALAGLLGVSVTAYALVDVDRQHRRLGFDPLLQILLAGTCAAFLAGDLFNLYVWFEVMLIASFALLALAGGRRTLDGAVKFVTLNLIATILLLAAIGLLYGVTGSLNMADLHQRVQAHAQPALLSAIAIAFLVAIGVKAAIFPLFFWVPAAYPAPPVAVAAMFAGLVTKVGVYALLRVFTLIFTHDVGYTHALMLVVAALTMVTGGLGAIAQHEFRRILAFHSISQVGYMVLGLALFTPLALAGAILFMAHHSVVKANLFLVSGIAARLGGSFELDRLGGLYRARPLLAFAFLISGLSLAGLPPFSGFWAKLLLVQATVDRGVALATVVALGTGLITLLSMSKIWLTVFWAPVPDKGHVRTLPSGEFAMLMIPVAILAALTLAVGLWLEPLFVLMARAAEGLLDPTAYVHAVLGVAP